MILFGALENVALTYCYSLCALLSLFWVLSELVEVAGVDVRSNAAALDLYFVGCAAQVDLRGSIAVGLNTCAVEAGIELRGSCAPRTQSIAFELATTRSPWLRG